MKKAAKQFWVILVALVMLLETAPVSALAEVLPAAQERIITNDVSEGRQVGIEPEKVHVLKEGEYTVAPVADPSALIDLINSQEQPAQPMRGGMRMLKAARPAPAALHASGFLAYDIELTDSADAALAYEVTVPVGVDMLKDYRDAYLPLNITNVSYQLHHIHTEEDGKVTAEKIEGDVTDKDGVINDFTITVGSFSSFVLQYTVDFVFEADGQSYELSLAGGDCVTLGTLAAALGIVPGEKAQAFSQDVSWAEFSTPELAYVGLVDTDTTLGAFKEALGLVCEYSAELTEADIAAINSRELSAGEWVLISLKPFTTPETLTLRMTLGEMFEISVTDAQIKKTVITESGEAYEITVTYEAETGIPEDADLEVQELLPGTEGYSDYVAKSEQALGIEAGSAEYIRMFDIKIVDQDDPAIKYQPKEGTSVDVRIELADKDISKEAEESTQVVHFADENDAGSLVNAETNGQTVNFAADGFSLYAIVEKNVTVEFLTADGKTLNIQVTFDSREVLPKGAKLEVSEVTYEEDPEAYAKRNERLAEALFEEYGNVAITDVRYLNISILIPDETAGEGDPVWNEYEPVYPMKVKISYTQPMDTTNPGEYTDYNDGSTKVTPDIGNHIVGVHYTEDGAEILETVDKTTDAGVSETITHTDGFSEYDFAYIYQYEIIGTNYNYSPSDIRTKAAVGEMLRGAGDAPAHAKTLTDNHDGTYKLSLTVTGDADTDNKTASNANVIIVFDTSNSMVNYYVPMANGARGSDNADGSSSYVLYYKDGNRYREANDGYSGTVYRKNGNNYTPYTGQRYSKTIRRADAAEKVLYDFAHALYAYKNQQDDPNTPGDERQNIQTALITFNRNATTVQRWTSTETDITNRVSSTGIGGSKKLANSSGTNWEAALQEAKTVISTADSDPTFVVFITDGQPTQVVGTADGTYITDGTPYVGARDDAYDVQQACAATGTESHGALFGIYAYGTEADYLDDMMYYAYTGNVYNDNLASAGQETFSTEGYYNAGDSAALADAINDIFSKIVKTLGVTGVSISDGTTSQVQTSTGTISELLEVDTGSFEYWLSLQTVNNKFSMKDLVTGENVEYTVSASGGNVTISWSKSGTNYSATYEGEYSNGIARIKWVNGTSFYNYTPPSATFNNSKVDWNLASVGTLLDGVTYEVTFDCYPSQYTYDTIAHLQNGDLQYNALDPEVKKYLTSGYQLKTNTAATLTYTDTRTQDGEQTSLYDNPEPVSTNYELLTINKEWLGGTPSSELRLPITVMMGDEVFHTAELTAATNWTTDAVISIGMIKNGEALPGTMGHDFSFAELDENQYRWELDAPTVRPMLINGTLTMLVKVDSKHPAPTGATTYTIEGSTYYVNPSMAGLTATNLRRSYLDVIKTVTGNNAPADATFDFTMKVVNSRASTAGDVNNLDSDYYVWFSVADSTNNYAIVIDEDLVSGNNVTRETEDGGGYTGYYYMPSGTEIHVNMKAGYSLRFLNLPSGSTYEVAESTVMSDERFSFVSITGTGTVDSNNNQKMTGTIETANTPYSVTVENKYRSINVKLEKVDEEENALAGSEFSLTRGTGENAKDLGSYAPGGTYTVTDAETGDETTGTYDNPIDLGSLGVGTYTLKETTAPEYYEMVGDISFTVSKNASTGELSATLASGAPATMKKDQDASTEDNAVYVITVPNAKKTATVKVIKQVVSDVESDRIMDFIFTPEGFNSNTAFMLKGTDIATTDENETTKTFTVPYGTVINVTEMPETDFDTKVTVTGATKNDEGKYQVEEEEIIFTFVNTRKTGSLIVKKVTEPAGIADNMEYKFTVKYGDLYLQSDETPFTFAANEFVFTVKPGETERKAFVGLPIGDYTVTELIEKTENGETTSFVEVSGYRYNGTTYTVGDGQPANDPSPATVTSGEDVEVTITNNYTQLTNAQVTKVLSDPINTKQQEFTFYAQLKEGEQDITSKLGDVINVEDSEYFGWHMFTLTAKNGERVDTDNKTFNDLPVGAKLTVKEVLPDETVYTVDAEEKIIYGLIALDANGDIPDDNKLTFTNTRKLGDLKIIKAVKYGQTTIDTEEFFYVTVQNSTGAYAKMAPEGKVTFVGEGEDIPTIGVRGNNSITLEDIPIDEYTVTEITDSTDDNGDTVPKGTVDIIPGYVYVDHSYSPETGKQTVTDKTAEGYTGPKEVTVTNNYNKLATVTIIKIVNGTDEDKDKAFNFTETGLTETDEPFVLYGRQLPENPTEGEPLTHENTKIYEKVPYGTTFSIAETANDDFDTTIEISNEATPVITTRTETGEVIVNADDITITYTNTKKTKNVSIIKTDEDKKPLAGASFALYKVGDDGDELVQNSREVDANGILDLGSLPIGTYHLVETQAPAGYIPITSPITIIVAADGVTATQGETPIDVQKDNDTWTIPVQNTAGVQLPSTGGPGTVLYTAAGLSLILGASLWLMLRRRKEQQN